MIIIVQTQINTVQEMKNANLKKQGHSTIAKGHRQRDVKDKNLQALFEDHTVHTATMTTQK